MKASSKWWAVPYGIGILALCYLVFFTRLGAQIYGGVSIALLVWFFLFSLYTLVHLMWLRVRRQRAAKVSE